MIEKCYIIPTEKLCNSNCEFCISKTRNYNKGREFLEINEEFLENLELLKKRGIKKYEITGGGEPLLHGKINIITSLIKKIIPGSYIKVYTNGNILKDIGPVDEINISVAHFNTEKNSEIMEPLVKIPLERKIDFFKNNNPGAKIRLSIPLIKGYIDSPKKLDEMINLTQSQIDEYVVRTLYTGCPNFEKRYIAFDYERKNVIIEKDNNVSDFKGIILWSDGSLYTNWDLKENRHLYSYLLLKPDSRTYINEINELIKKSNFNIKEKLLLNNFYENAQNFYIDKTKEYLSIVKRHLLNSVQLFGNTGLIYILDKEKSQSDLLTDTYKLKQDIRNAFAFTQSYGGFINYEGENYQLNLVHAPDPEIELYNRDINMIKTFKETIELTENEIKLIKKYRSFNI